jgi:hypothetical protein
MDLIHNFRFAGIKKPQSSYLGRVKGNINDCMNLTLKTRKLGSFRGMFTRAIAPIYGVIAAVTFFPPDYTVGSGIPPDRAHSLVGYTTDRELQPLQFAAHPAPKVVYLVTNRL